MSYGFLAVNDSGQVLVSSDTRNLHFVEKAYYYSTLASNNDGAGMRQYAYRCSSSVAPVPFFTMPNSSAYYGWGAIRTIDTSYSKIVTSDIVSIQDPNTTAAPTYSFSGVPVSLYEEATATIIINTTNVDNGTVMFWNIPNSVGNDFQDTSGTFTINNNTGSFTITPTRYYDTLPENGESYTITIGYGRLITGTVVETSNSFSVTNNPLGTTVTGFGEILYIANSNNTNWGPASIDERTNSDPGAANYFKLGRYNAATAILTSSTIKIPSSTQWVYSASVVNTVASEGYPFTVYIDCPQASTGHVINWQVSNYDQNQFVESSGTAVFNGTQAAITLTPLLDRDYIASANPYTGAVSFTVSYWDNRRSPGSEYIWTSPTYTISASGNPTYQAAFGKFDGTNYNNTNWGPFSLIESGTYGQKYTLTGTDITTRVYDMYFSSGTTFRTTPIDDLYWTINHITTSPSDFVATTGKVLIDTSLASRSQMPYFPYFYIAAAADSTTEGTEKFTVTVSSSITPSLSFTSGEIRIQDTSLGGRTLPYMDTPAFMTGATNIVNIGITGYANGTKLYWRINHGNTTYEDFNNSQLFGDVIINNNAGSFTVGLAFPTRTIDKDFTISITDVAPNNYMYWSINHISTTDSDFYSTSGYCTGTGYGYWYWYINALTDTKTEGTEKFTITVREGGPSGSIVATTGAIKINDLSTGHKVITPTTILEQTANIITVNTVGLSNGTVLYWVIDNITTADVDFERSYGPITINNNTGTFTLKPIRDRDFEQLQQFTISIQTEVPNIWQLELLKSGTDDTIPEVYVFADPRVASPADSQSHGLLVYRDDGTVSFDSRREPLAISGGGTVQYPYSPVSSINLPQGEGTAYWHDACMADGNTGSYFTPDSENTYNLGTLPAKPIFFATSLAQACQSASSSHNTVEGIPGFISQRKDWRSDYWCFYRGGIRASGNSIMAGWVAIAHGCGWYYSGPQNNFLGVIDWGGYPKTGTNPPYSNETINLSANAVLIADGSRYD